MWLKDSSIGRKLVMSITGTFLVLFLLFHGTMNLCLVIDDIFGTTAYNWICSMLGANWYAIIGSLIIALAVVVHFAYAIVLTVQNRRARGNDRYAVEARQEGVDWASKNMLALGAFILFGLAFHLYDFWSKMQLAEIKGNAPVDGIDQIKFIFSNNYFSVMYLLWLVAIWFHLSHGIASVMQSIGWSNHVWQRRIEFLGNFFATIIVLMFVSVVIYYWIII